MIEKLMRSNLQKLSSQPEPEKQVIFKTASELQQQQQLVAQRLKERYSQVPSYALKAAKDSKFWERLAASRINFV